MAGACGDDLSRLQRHAKLAQFVGEPGQRDAGIADIGATVCSLLDADRAGLTGSSLLESA